MDHRDLFARAVKAREELAERDRSRRVSENKIRLERNICRSIMTLSIGTIAEFEREFGSLWGHGKRGSQLTEDEKRWRDVWQQMRSVILDDVNRKIRTLTQELERYEIHNKLYHYGVKKDG